MRWQWTRVMGGLAALLAVPVVYGQEDPWPQWQRTPTRLGNTMTVGPKTPTIEWSIQFDPDFANIHYIGSPIMDAQGHIYITRNRGLTAIDSVTREVAWYFDIADSGDYTPAYGDGYVVFGSPTDYIYCVDAETGQEVWSFSEPGRPNLSPLIYNDIVYYITQLGDLKARNLSDGSLVWATMVGNSSFSQPSTDELGLIFSGWSGGFQARAVKQEDGSLEWTAPLNRWHDGSAPVDLNAGPNGRVYYMDFNANLHSIDRLTGEEAWVVDLGNSSTGEVCVGHDSTVYAGSHFGGDQLLTALSTDGDIIWQHLIGTEDGIAKPPIVDGDGTIYFTTFKTLGGTGIGRVHALNPDGSVLWIKVMPDRVASSPMLGPDGTLYVNCSDTYLYAFKDPCRPDLNNDGTVNTQDFLLFLNAWADSDPLADWNNDGNINTIDFLGYLNDWAEGC